MTQWLFRMCATAAVLVFASVASAALTSISGQVTKFEAGKSISVKDTATGSVQTLSLSKDTALEGDVKVGAQVSVQADGKKARSVSAMAAQAPGANPGGSSMPDTHNNSDFDTMGGASSPGSSSAR